MDINNLTLGQAKELAELFGAPQATLKQHPFVGMYVIARGYAFGVHAGEVVSVDGENVILKDSNRLWNWKANDGIALSGLAQKGIQSGCKVDIKNPIIYLANLCELIPCSEIAKTSIKNYEK